MYLHWLSQWERSVFNHQRILSLTLVRGGVRHPTLPHLAITALPTFPPPRPPLHLLLAHPLPRLFLPHCCNIHTFFDACVFPEQRCNSATTKTSFLSSSMFGSMSSSAGSESNTSIRSIRRSCPCLGMIWMREGHRGEFYSWDVHASLEFFFLVLRDAC
jgi:hypothetical protein